MGRDVGHKPPTHQSNLNLYRLVLLYKQSNKLPGDYSILRDFALVKLLLVCIGQSLVSLY